jgi:hypothetical protein
MQFTTHAGPRKLLLATASAGPAGAAVDLVEASPHDFFWGRGVDGSGANHLGTLLMSIRAELAPGAAAVASAAVAWPVPAQAPAPGQGKLGSSNGAAPAEADEAARRR